MLLAPLMMPSEPEKQGRTLGDGTFHRNAQVRAEPTPSGRKTHFQSKKKKKKKKNTPPIKGHPKAQKTKGNSPNFPKTPPPPPRGKHPPFFFPPFFFKDLIFPPPLGGQHHQ
eukprot:FR736426.1.p1 GENE.FR736426.1~~FR736426.1.p1  ORF type:complete len:112 (+),score=79.52 FR736426.1:890-1225(+)